MNANEIVEAVGQHLNDPNLTGWNKNEVLRQVSAYSERFFARARTANEEFFTDIEDGVLSETDFTTDADDSSLATAPFNSWLYTNITGVWIRQGSRRDVLTHLYGTDEPPRYRHDDDRDHLTYSALRYDIKGDRFELYGAIPSTFSIEIAFERMPPKLFIGKVSNTNHAGSNSTMDLLWSENPVSGHLDRVTGRYIGSRIQSIGSSYRNIWEITAYGVSATKATLTLRGVAAEITNASEVALLPSFPEDFHELLALGGAVLCLGSRGQSKQYRLLKEQRDEALQQAIVLLEQRTSEIRNVYRTR